MNLFKFRLGIVAGLTIIGGMGLNQANALTVQAYANNCKTELQIGENIPGFDCERGMLMGNSLFGAACDSQATLGGPGCTEGQRLGQVSFTNKNIKGIFMCRKYENRTLGAEQYSDIALIVSNKSTGQTCFFQSPVDGALGRNVPSPHDTVNANTVWKNDMNPRVECVRCHSNDPYIITPHVITGFNRLNLTGFNPLGAYKVLENASVISYQPNLPASSPGTDCTQCHRAPSVAAGSWMSTLASDVYSTSGLWNIQNKGIRRGKADMDIFRPSTGNWYHRETDTGATKGLIWGQAGDKVMKGDFDGDGQSDMSLWRPSTRQLLVYRSSTKSAWSRTFGLSTDIPAPADYDGDGRDDLALYRPSTGEWLIIDGVSSTYTTLNLGKQGVPVPGDYDGDLKADIAVWEPSTGNWYVKSGTTTVTTKWGQNGDIPTPADFSGDGIVDRAVFRPSEGKWYVLGATASWRWGMTGDIPMPADFDGDSKADLAFFRPSEGKWYWADSSKAFGSAWSLTWGQNGDQPVTMYQNK